tara:strand:+ start:52933 stop:53142 length:210 start_codon:yes stop_codon:yes gene_type:complete
MGKCYLNVELLQQNLAHQRHVFIRDENFRLKHFHVYALSQANNGYVDTQDALLDDFTTATNESSYSHKT